MRVFLISGKMGSGKTTLSVALAKNYQRFGFGGVRALRFAATLYELHEFILNRMETLTGKPRKKKDGALLQMLGTDWGRKNLGENVWVEIVQRQVEALVGINCMVLLDDCRFPNELLAFPNAVKIRLECDRDIRKARCDSWRDDENHPSETALDQLDLHMQFDHVFDTGTKSVDSIVEDLVQWYGKKDVPDDKR